MHVRSVRRSHPLCQAACRTQVSRAERCHCRLEAPDVEGGGEAAAVREDHPHVEGGVAWRQDLGGVERPVVMVESAVPGACMVEPVEYEELFCLL